MHVMLLHAYAQNDVEPAVCSAASVNQLAEHATHCHAVAHHTSAINAI